MLEAVSGGLAHDVERDHLFELKLLELEEAEFYLQQYYAFVTEVIPYNFRQIRDPQVQKNLRKFGEIILDWIQTYKCMNKMCLAHIDDELLDETWLARKKVHRCQHQDERRMVMMEHPRGTVKSAGVTKVVPHFIHAHLTEVAGGVMSAEYKRMGSKFSGAIRKIWEGLPGSKLNQYYGPYVEAGKNKTWTDEKMYTAQRKDQSGEATLNLFSIETGAGGYHLKFLIVDDPTTQALVRKYGDNWHEKVWDEYQEWNTVVDDDGILVLVYTRYGEEDLPGKIRKNIILPDTIAALGEKPEDFDERYAYYAKKYSGIDLLATQAWHEEEGEIVPHYPTIWSKKRIERLLQRGPKSEEWAYTQLQNRPWESSDNPINDALLNMIPIAWDDIGKEFFYDFTIHCDTAHSKARKQDRGDESVISVWGHNGRGDVCWLWGWHGRAPKHVFGQQYQRAVQWCYMDKLLPSGGVPGSAPRIVTIDAARGGAESEREYLTGMLHKIGIPGVPVHEKKSYDGLVGGDQKERAIKNTFGYLQDGRVRALDSLGGLETWFHQLKRLGGGGRDDIADANKDVFLPNVYIQPGLRDDTSVGVDGAFDIPQPIDFTDTGSVSLVHAEKDQYLGMGGF